MLILAHLVLAQPLRAPVGATFDAARLRRVTHLVAGPAVRRSFARAKLSPGACLAGSQPALGGKAAPGAFGTRRRRWGRGEEAGGALSAFAGRERVAVVRVSLEGTRGAGATAVAGRFGRVVGRHSAGEGRRPARVKVVDVCVHMEVARSAVGGARDGDGAEGKGGDSGGGGRGADDGSAVMTPAPGDHARLNLAVDRGTRFSPAASGKRPIFLYFARFRL